MKLFLYLILLSSGSTRHFEYYFVDARIPADWKKANVQRVPNGVMFKKDNKKVTVLSFGKEHYYFDYPTLIIIYPTKVLSTSDIYRFAKGPFARMVIPNSLRDWRLVWNKPQSKESKTRRGYKLLYYAFSGYAKHSTFASAPVAVQVVVIEDKNRSMLIATGFCIRDVNGFTKKELADIQTGFMDHVRDVLAVANNVKFVNLKEDNSLKRMLTRKKKFRHESSFSVGFNTGMYSNNASGKRKIYFDFYKNGTCRFIDNGVITGFFKTNYSFSNETSQLGTSINVEGSKKWSDIAPFDVYKGKEREYLVVHFPKNKGGDRVFVIEKRGKEKCGKKIIKGLAISGKVEGYFLTTGVVCNYVKEK